MRGPAIRVEACICKNTFACRLQMKFRVDNIVFLLSTDWFLSYWVDCGLQSELEQRLRLQSECRKLAHDIVGNAESYWDVEFSDPREDNTKRQFLNLLKIVPIKDADRNILAAHVNADGDDIKHSTFDDAAHLLVGLFLQSGSEELKGEQDIGIDARRRLENLYIQCFQQHEQELHDVAPPSSAWDLWIQSLTPDLPQMMLDTARGLCRSIAREAKFRAGLRDVLSLEQRMALVSWMSTASRDLLENQTSFDWLL